MKTDFSPIHSVHARSPVPARLLLTLIGVDFTPVSLETRQADASEAFCVVMATAAVETRL